MKSWIFIDSLWALIMISPKGLTFLSQPCNMWGVDRRIHRCQSGRCLSWKWWSWFCYRKVKRSMPPNVKAKTLFSLLADVAARLTANILKYQGSNIIRENVYSIFKVSWSPRKALACSHLELRPRNRIPLPLDTPTRCLWVKVEYILTQSPHWFKVLFLSLFMNQNSRCVWLWAAIAVAVTVPKISWMNASIDDDSCELLSFIKPVNF